MIYLVSFLFAALGFGASMLCYLFVFRQKWYKTKEAPAEGAGKAGEEEEAPASDEKAGECISFVEIIKNAIIKKNHSALAVSIAFAVIGAVFGGFAFHHIVNGDTEAVPVIGLVRLSFAYSCMVIFALTDIESFTVPNRILLSFLALRILLIPFEYFFEPDMFWAIMRDCFIGAAACFIILLFISFVSRGGIGMGDVKLMTLATLITGAYCAFNTLLFGLFACAVFSIAALLFGKKKIKDKIPFVPFIYIGLVTSVILGSF